MCGIVYVKRLDGKQAAKSVIKRYNKQKDRGIDGFGYIALNGKDKPGELYRATNEKDILTTLEKEKAPEIMFHHRTPTSTPNLKDLNHPIRISLPDSEYLYWLVHNGIITNDDELKKKHDKLGIDYSTICEKITKTLTETITTSYFNDSETFGIEFVLTIEKRQKENEARGNTAFILLQTDKQGKPINLYYGRNNGNPLKYYQQKELIAITSEGQGSLLEKEMLYCYNYKTEKTEKTKMSFGIAIETSLSCNDSYGYGHGRQNAYGYYGDIYEEDDIVIAGEMTDKEIDVYCALTEQKEKLQRLIQNAYLGNCYQKDMEKIEKWENQLSIIEYKLEEYERKYQMVL